MYTLKCLVLCELHLETNKRRSGLWEGASGFSVFWVSAPPDRRLLGLGPTGADRDSCTKETAAPRSRSPPASQAHDPRGGWAWEPDLGPVLAHSPSRCRLLPPPWLPF